MPERSWLQCPAPSPYRPQNRYRRFPGNVVVEEFHYRFFISNMVVEKFHRRRARDFHRAAAACR